MLKWYNIMSPDLACCDCDISLEMALGIKLTVPKLTLAQFANNGLVCGLIW